MKRSKRWKRPNNVIGFLGEYYAYCCDWRGHYMYVILEPFCNAAQKAALHVSSLRYALEDAPCVVI